MDHGWIQNTWMNTELSGGVGGNFGEDWSHKVPSSPFKVATSEMREPETPEVPKYTTQKYAINGRMEWCCCSSCWNISAAGNN